MFYSLNKCWRHVSLQNLILGGLNRLFSNLQEEGMSQVLSSETVSNFDLSSLKHTLRHSPGMVYPYA